MSRNPILNLDEENRNEVLKYLHFFRMKRDGLLRGLNTEFNDIKNDHLNEDMYSRDDVVEYTDTIASTIRAHLAHEISVLVNMSALAVTELLEAAQDQRVDLSFDISSLENQGLIDSIEKMSLDSMTPNAKRRSTSLKSDAKALQAESKAMRDEAERLEDSNRTLQQRFVSVQSEASKLLKEKSAMQLEIAELKAQLSTAERRNRQADTSGKHEEDLHHRIEILEDNLAAEMENNKKRVADTPQFQQMRRMMQSQNIKLRDLRRRLARYEPDATKEDDDDEEF